MATPVEQVKSLFEAYKKICPNAFEKYDPTPENVARWRYHIKEAGNMPKLVPISTRPTKTALAWKRARQVKEWENMEQYMRERYLHIASFLPFVQVYAVGSRVDGTYVEQWSSAKDRAFRRQLGKPEKVASDYDVFASVQVSEKGRLPSYADLLTTKPQGKAIKIPMWNFDKLPKERHADVIALYNSERWGDLMVIHNMYALSENVYCCDPLPIIRYFKAAIENGTITENTAQVKAK